MKQVLGNKGLRFLGNKQAPIFPTLKRQTKNKNLIIIIKILCLFLVLTSISGIAAVCRVDHKFDPP